MQIIKALTNNMHVLWLWYSPQTRDMTGSFVYIFLEFAHSLRSFLWQDLEQLREAWRQESLRESVSRLLPWKSIPESFQEEFGHHVSFEEAFLCIHLVQASKVLAWKRNVSRLVQRVSGGGYPGKATVLWFRIYQHQLWWRQVEIELRFLLESTNDSFYYCIQNWLKNFKFTK